MRQIHETLILPHFKSVKTYTPSERHNNISEQPLRLEQTHKALCFHQTSLTKRDNGEPPAPETTHNRKKLLRLEKRKRDVAAYVGSPHDFVPAADDLPADGRNVAIPARSSVSSSRPLSVQLCGCTTAVILGARGIKMLPPHDNCISAGLLLEKCRL